MKRSEKSLSWTILLIIAWFEVLYIGFSILFNCTLKIVTFSSLNEDILTIKAKWTHVQFHLKALGFLWLDIDVDTMEDVMHGLLWFIFAMGLVWLLFNLSMAIFFLLLGVLKRQPKKLHSWILFGLLTLLLDVLAFPLERVICDGSQKVVGSICGPPGNRLWLTIPIKLIHYVSIILSWFCEKEVKNGLDHKKITTVKFKKGSKALQKNDGHSSLLSGVRLNVDNVDQMDHGGSSEQDHQLNHESQPMQLSQL